MMNHLKTIGLTIAAAWIVGAITILLVSLVGGEPPLGPNDDATPVGVFMLMSLMPITISSAIGYGIFRAIARRRPDQAMMIFGGLALVVATLYTVATSLEMFPGIETAGQKWLVGIMHYTVAAAQVAIITRMPSDATLSQAELTTAVA